MKKLIVSKSEAKVILSNDQFTFVRRIYPRGGGVVDAAEKAYPIGARFWVAEPMYIATGPNGEYALLYDADPRDAKYLPRTVPTPGYRIQQNDSRHIVEVVSIGKSINQQKWAEVAHLDVTFKKVGHDAKS